MNSYLARSFVVVSALSFGGIAHAADAEFLKSLDGKCTGLVVVSRAIGADIKTDGKSYTGTYTGSRTGPAGLSGKRSGNALNLGIRWAKEVNGDRAAKLRLEKVGDNGMRLTTVDTDPATGKQIVTSEINLRRL